MPDYTRSTESAPDQLDDLFDDEWASEPIELPEWYQGAQDFGDQTPRVSRQRYWFEGSPTVVSGRDPSDPMDWAMSTVGLSIPTLGPSQGRVARDAVLKRAAKRLLEQGYGELLSLVGQGDTVTPGFEGLAPKVLKASRRFRRWYRALEQRTDGTLEQVWGEQMLVARDTYDALRSSAQHILEQQGGELTRLPLPGRNFYQPPGLGETWADWLRRWGTGASIGAGAVLALAFLWWLRRR